MNAPLPEIEVEGEYVFRTARDHWANAASQHRARRASHRALFHGLGHTAPIAFAVFALVYFAGQLARGWLA